MSDISLLCEIDDNIVTDNVSQGDEFLMRFPIPPTEKMREASDGKEWLEVESSYEGRWDNDYVEELINSSRIKVLYLDPGKNSHHVVGFCGFKWVNDAVALSFIDCENLIWKETIEA
jgi:hypothetical protein